jgi:hypothetical protein
MPSNHKKMSSNSDPVRLLEPPDLMEPLDLRDGFLDPPAPSQRRPPVSSASSSGPASTMGYMRPRASAPTSAPAGWASRSALIVGALACFGAGIALSRLPGIVLDHHPSPDRSHVSPPPAIATTMEPAVEPPASTAGERKLTETNLADSNATESSVREPRPLEPKQPEPKRPQPNGTLSETVGSAATSASRDLYRPGELPNSLPPRSPPPANAREPSASRSNPLTTGSARPCTADAGANERCLDGDGRVGVTKHVPRQLTKLAPNQTPDAADATASVPNRRAAETRQTSSRHGVTGGQEATNGGTDAVPGSNSVDHASPSNADSAFELHESKPPVLRERHFAAAADVSTCFPSASAVRQDHPEAWPSWTLRTPGHEGARCWYAAPRTTARPSR